jgi:NADH-quinone oxidoreductase subunit E
MISEDRLERIREIGDHYPNAETGLLKALFVAQEEKNYLEEEDVQQVAEELDMDDSEVWSVASFYTMINQEPTGQFKIQVCQNLSCMIEGADEIIEHLESRLGIEEGETTPDELFTLEAVECLGSCGTGPVCQVNDRAYHENLDADDVDELLEQLRQEAEETTEPSEEPTEVVES